MKHILYIDYKASKGNYRGWDYVMLDAKHLADAMAEAEKYMNDNVYLMRVMRQDGKAERIGSATETRFKAIIERRSGGWNICGVCDHVAKWVRMRFRDGSTTEYAEAV